MRITNITIKNYRAFYGEYNFKINGKNLMVFGENGSGKSSFYHAMKTFFEASKKVVPMQDYENIFIPASEKETAKVELTFNAKGSSSNIRETLSYDGKKLSDERNLVAAANSVKGFLDYRSLLKTHINHKEAVNIFEVVLEVLSETFNRFSERTFGEEWSNIWYDAHEYKQGVHVRNRVHANLNNFNDGFKASLEEIEKDANLFLQEFIKNVKIKLNFDGVEYYNRKGGIGNMKLVLEVVFCDESIPKHQFFLNEARLSALAISLYLASIKINPTQGELKVLFLDDLLIGLDMSNRLPLLKIIKEHFVDCEDNFQIFMTTYDKIWFELVRNHFGKNNWEYIEMYPKKLKDEDFEISVVFPNQDFVEKAEYYLEERDYKASAVYIRTEFERLVKKIAENLKLRVIYKTKTKEYKSDDFWKIIDRDTNIPDALKRKIETHRETVMNPFSHYDLEKPEFRQELKDTIEAVKELKTLFRARNADNTRVLIKSVPNVEALQREIQQLNNTIAAKDNTINRMRNALRNRNGNQENN